MPCVHPAQGVRRRKFDILLVPQIAPQDTGCLHRFRRSPHADSTGCGRGDRQSPRSAQPAVSRAALTARAWSTAPGAVAVQAERVDRGRPASSACSTIDARLGEHRARLGPVDQPAVGRRTRGRGTPRATPPDRPPRRHARQHARHRRARRAPSDPSSTCLRLVLVVEDPVVERAVRLHVAHRGTGALRDLPQRARPGRPPAHAARRGPRHGRPAEVLPVVVGHLRADRHAELGGPLAHRPHDRGVAGVVAAGHVGAGHDLEQRGVVGDLLAEVGVQVDVLHEAHARPG